MHQTAGGLSLPATTGPTDPLADIPEREHDKPRGDAASTIFDVDFAVKEDECRALVDLFHLYDKSDQTSS